MLAFEDFVEGASFPLPPYEVTREEVIEFAQEFDPQPFHLDEEAAAHSLLGGLSASGWHTCSMAMRMMVDGYLANSTSQGAPGVEELRWLRPVRPGDTLSGSATVLKSRPLASRPGVGIATIGIEIVNQTGETVMDCRYVQLLGLRGENGA